MRGRALWIAVVLCVTLPLCAAAETGTVTASALVLREGPGIDQPMLGEIPGGAQLTLLSYSEGWYFIQYGEQYGYVSARYVRVNLPQGAPEPVATPDFPFPYPSAIVQTPPDLSLPALSFTGENNPNYPRVLKPGDMGNSVIDLQKTLAAFGYAVTADGQYGYDTQASVMKLQRKLGLEPDGIVGANTRRLIGNDHPGGVEKLDWWLGGNVAVARLNEATVVDVRTGKRFRISRYGGDNHCDAEPATTADTRTFQSVAGGAWTWDRRPIWLEVNGRVIAASMNCMPHEGQHIFDNDFDGHFCIHFFNSRTHDTDRIDEQHEACVREAWSNRERYGK